MRNCASQDLLAVFEKKMELCWSRCSLSCAVLTQGLHSLTKRLLLRSLNQDIYVSLSCCSIWKTFVTCINTAVVQKRAGSEQAVALQKCRRRFIRSAH